MKRAMESPEPETAGPMANIDGDGDGADREGFQGLASDNFLSLPAWFPADKASAILRQTGKRFVLVSDRNGIERVTDLRQLASAPSTKTVSWCALPLGPSVGPQATLDEVLRLMEERRSAYLPVVVGGMIVGIVARDAATPRSRERVLGQVAA
jgi:Mg/Co/Ni transporter MgtE